jgi:hypothetical protein
MELLAVDASGQSPKNANVTVEELRIVGPKLRGMRVARGLKQADIPKDPKANGLSLGTLQAIESAWYEVRDANVEKYARFLGTTREQLRQPDKPKTLTPTDPLLKDLNDEHLEIARRYMRARKRVRTAIELLLGDHPQEQQLTLLLEKLERATPEQLTRVEAWLATADHIAQLIERIRQRCVTDPSYLEMALKNDGLEQQAADRLKESKKSTPIRRVTLVSRTVRRFVWLLPRTNPSSPPRVPCRPRKSSLMSHARRSRRTT